MVEGYAGLDAHFRLFGVSYGVDGGRDYRPSPRPAPTVWVAAEDVAVVAPAKLLLSAPAEPALDPATSSAVADPDAGPAPAEPKTEFPPIENKPTRNP